MADKKEVQKQGLGSITKETKTTGNKYIKPTKENPITLTYISEARVVMAKVEKESSLFVGMEIPRLEIDFIKVSNDKLDTSVKYTETMFLANLSCKTEKAFVIEHNKILSKIKHFIEVLKLGYSLLNKDVKPEISEEELAKLFIYTDKEALKAESYTEIAEIYSNKLEAYAKDYTNFFNNVAELINKYKEYKSDKVFIWLKLVFDNYSKFFKTTSFVNEGIIEVFRKGIPTTLSIRVSRGETIEEIAQTSTNHVASPPENNNGGSSAIPSWL